MTHKQQVTEKICSDPKCHWVDWFGYRAIYASPPIGYQRCPRDHGEAGRIEAYLYQNLYAAFAGPIVGIQKVAIAWAAELEVARMDGYA